MATTGNPLADKILNTTASMQRQGYTEPEIKAAIEEETDKHTTGDVAVAAEALARPLKK
ncbi:hypothetical protein [Streptomyces sp. 184]|uniref:hypothetical protein n=1 Tax=Streptomyces sp. 184 TaxID=1827526 RepID=UPI0038929B41